jgi:hypothetical protein
MCRMVRTNAKTAASFGLRAPSYDRRRVCLLIHRPSVRGNREQGFRSTPGRPVVAQLSIHLDSGQYSAPMNPASTRGALSLLSLIGRSQLK